MKNVYVYSYNTVSNGAAELADALGVNRIRHNGSHFRGAGYKTVINWGAGELPPEVQKCRIVNRCNVIRLVSNKLSFFRAMTDAPSPPQVVPWTDKVSTAQEWLKKHTVVIRTSLTGHSGHGIIIVEPGSPITPSMDAHLYTQYIPKSHEFRLHILAGRVIDAQRKIRDPDREPKDWKVRSHDNGFIYVRSGFTVPPDVQEESLKAFVASGLDFGAVDVIWSEKQRKAYVLEINSAPGLEGQTIQSYAEGFKKLLT